MKKICFGKGIESQNNKMCNLTNNIKQSLTDVYRLPVNLINMSNCFSNCTKLSVFEANIPSTVTDLSNSFLDCISLYKSVTIPNSVVNMKSSFKNSNIESVIYAERSNQDLNNTINLMETFSNSGLKEIKMINNLKIDNGYRAFYGSKIQKIDEDLIINDGTEMFKSSQIQTVNNIKSNSSKAMFENSKNLSTVGIIESDDVTYIFNNCSNLKSVSLLKGNLNLYGTFDNCNSYNDVVYLAPMGEVSHISFLYNHPVRIYGRNHSLNTERDLANYHYINGDFISGYCDPDDFNNLGQYIGDNGNNVSLFLQHYRRTNLLDPQTLTEINYSNSFQNKTFNYVGTLGSYSNSKEIKLYNSFRNSKINFLNVSDLTIDSINGFRDTTINNVYGAFYNIPDNSFCNANIKDIFYSYGANIVGNDAFKNATASSFEFMYLNNINDNAFSNVKTNNFYAIQIQNIGTNSFSNFGNISFEFFKNSGTGDIVPIIGKIHENAFSNSNIKQLKISPEHKNDINNGALSNCNSLENLIYRFPNDEIYNSFPHNGESHAGRLFNAIQKGYTGITNYYCVDNGFSSGTYIDRDKIPNSLKSIEIQNSPYINMTIKGMNNITDINIYPKSKDVSDINYMFDGCDNLSNITMSIYTRDSDNLFRNISPSVLGLSSNKNRNYNISYIDYFYGYIKNTSSPYNWIVSSIEGNFSFYAKSLYINNKFHQSHIFNNVSFSNFSDNITIFPSLFVENNPYTNDGRYFYSYEIQSNCDINTNNIGLLSPAFWYGSLKDNKTYYLPKDTIIQSLGSCENSVIYIDRLNITSSQVRPFSYVRNSKIYFNGIDSTQFNVFNNDKGYGTTMFMGDENGQPFNVQTMINNMK